MLNRLKTHGNHELSVEKHSRAEKNTRNLRKKSYFTGFWPLDCIIEGDDNDETATIFESDMGINN